MSRIKITFLSIFCGGLLFIGMGIGVMFLEFTSLTYIGEKVPDDAQTREQVFNVTLKSDDSPIHVMSNRFSYMNSKEALKISSSESVPKGQMEISFVYKTIGPTVDIRSHYSDDNVLNVDLNLYNFNDFGVFMACKDEALSDLKNGDIGVYLPLYFESITVKANPEDLNRIHPFGEENTREI